MRQVKVTKTLEDGTVEITMVDIPEKGSKKSPKKSTTSRKKKHEDKEDKEEKQTSSISKASVGFKRSEV